MTGGNVAQQTRIRLEDAEEARQELPGRRVLLEVPVDAAHEIGDRFRFVDLEVHGRVHRRHEQRGRNSLAGHVGDEKAQAAARQRKKVEVVSSDLTCGLVPGGDLQAGDVGRSRGRI